MSAISYICHQAQRTPPTLLLLLPPLSQLASHLYWPGCQLLVLLCLTENAGCQTRWGRLKSAWRWWYFTNSKPATVTSCLFHALGSVNSSYIASYLCQDNYVNYKPNCCMSSAGHWGYLNSICPASPLFLRPPPLTRLLPPSATVISSLRLWSGLWGPGAACGTEWGSCLTWQWLQLP